MNRAYSPAIAESVSGSSLRAIATRSCEWKRSVFECWRNAPFAGTDEELCRMVGCTLPNRIRLGAAAGRRRLMPLWPVRRAEAMMRADGGGHRTRRTERLLAPPPALNEVVVCAWLSRTMRAGRNYRELAREAGVASSWSTPVRGANDGLLATFAVYLLVLEPMPEDLDLTAAAASLAGVLIERFRAPTRPCAKAMRAIAGWWSCRSGVALHDERGIRYANPALARILGAPDAGSLVGSTCTNGWSPESRARRTPSPPRAGVRSDRALCRIPPAPARRRGDRHRVGWQLVEAGGRRMVQTYVRDITRRKWVERELQRVNDPSSSVSRNGRANWTNVNRELESFFLHRGSRFASALRARSTATPR